jgi:urea transport system substrate-binding protein
MSTTVAEEEIRIIGPEFMVGHLTAWNYYQTTQSAENFAFVTAYKDAYGAERVTSSPIEAAYSGVYLWKALVEAADSTATDAVRAAAISTEVAYLAPEGPLQIDGETQHT